MLHDAQNNSYTLDAEHTTVTDWVKTISPSATDMWLNPDTGKTTFCEVHASSGSEPPFPEGSSIGAEQSQLSPAPLAPRRRTETTFVPA